jgi:hypothetical protein
MKNTVFVHIGLHKTATTALQKQYFNKLSSITYAGRVGGGFYGNDPIYEIICGYCFGIEGISINDVKSAINKKLINGSFLISEEWLTSDYDGLKGLNGENWQNKLNKLAEVLNGIEHKVLLTLRAPSDCSFSLYCEFGCVGVAQKYPTYLDFVVNSNECEIFKYENTIPLITSKFSAVCILPYDLLVQNSEMFFSELSRFFESDITLELEMSYVTNKDEIGVYSQRYNFVQRCAYKLIGLLSEELKEKLRTSPLMRIKSKIFNQINSELIVYPSLADKEKISVFFNVSNDLYLKNLRQYKL